jgi:hypothetical protein
MDFMDNPNFHEMMMNSASSNFPSSAFRRLSVHPTPNQHQHVQDILASPSAYKTNWPIRNGLSASTSPINFHFDRRQQQAQMFSPMKVVQDFHYLD